jgi:hypothetical protein
MFHFFENGQQKTPNKSGHPVEMGKFALEAGIHVT